MTYDKKGSRPSRVGCTNRTQPVGEQLKSPEVHPKFSFHISSGHHFTEETLLRSRSSHLATLRCPVEQWGVSAKNARISSGEPDAMLD